MFGSSAKRQTSGTALAAMYPGHRVLAMFPFLNEAPKLQSMARRLRPGIVDTFIGFDNGSTDGGSAILEAHGIPVISQPTRGVGSCIRAAIEYGRANGYDILIVMAGNDKDDPEEIPTLLAPILNEQADYVQGSRFMAGGSSVNLPFFRWFAIKFLSVIFNVFSRNVCTDLTNGFRAYRLSLFNDRRININQTWLNTYEFEYYLHLKVSQCGYRVVEVPVTKTYPGTPGIAYTKIQPGIGWWKMLRPFIFLALGLKK